MRLIDSCINTGKALELRFEQYGLRYQVILEGMQVNIKTGTIYPSPDDDSEPYLFTENNTYKCYLCKDYFEAKETYNALRRASIE